MSHHRLRPALVPVLSGVLALVAAEVVVRAFFAAEVDTESLRTLDRQLEVGDFIQPSDDPDLLFELEPGVTVRWHGVTVAISADGQYRESAKGSGTARDPIKVALIGDSTPFGWKTEYEHAYGELFRARLQARAGRDVELRNYAVPGYNAIQHWVVFRDKVVDWAPDLAILHYDHNDPDPTNGAPPGYIPPEYGDNPLRSALFKFAWRRLRTARNARTRHFREETGAETRLVDGFRAAGPLYRTHLEDLQRLARAAEAAGIPAVIMIYDSHLSAHANARSDPHYTELHAALTSRLQEFGYQVLDLYPRYQRLMAERGWKNLTPFWLDAGDGHPNRYGHLFMAEQLLDFVLARPGLVGPAGSVESADGGADRSHRER